MPPKKGKGFLASVQRSANVFVIAGFVRKPGKQFPKSGWRRKEKRREEKRKEKKNRGQARRRDCTKRPRLKQGRTAHIRPNKTPLGVRPAVDVRPPTQIRPKGDRMVRSWPGGEGAVAGHRPFPGFARSDSETTAAPADRWPEQCADQEDNKDCPPCRGEIWPI